MRRLAVLLVVAVFGCGPGGEEAGPAAEQESTASTATTAIVETTTSAPPGTTAGLVAGGFEWLRVPHDEAVFADSAMQGVTSGGPGLVAVGQRFVGDRGVAALWTSPDGFSWLRVPDDEAVFADSAMRDVTAGGPGLVAVGTEGVAVEAVAAVWTSPDGFSWSRVPHDEAVFASSSAMSSVTVGGPGLVAVGTEGVFGEAVAAIWTSFDGLIWSRVPHDEAVFGIGSAQDVTAGGPGLVAVGTEGVPGEGVAAVWTSPDGLIWSRVPHDEAVFGGEGNMISRSVTADVPGLVAVGTHALGLEEGTIPVVWTSADGIVWIRVPNSETAFEFTPQEDGDTAGTLLGVEVGGMLTMEDVIAGGAVPIIVGHESSVDSSGVPNFAAAVWYSSMDGS
jgi:hypothetical protein